MAQLFAKLNNLKNVDMVSSTALEDVLLENRYSFIFAFDDDHQDIQKNWGALCKAISPNGTIVVGTHRFGAFRSPHSFRDTWLLAEKPILPHLPTCDWVIHRSKLGSQQIKPRIDRTFSVGCRCTALDFLRSNGLRTSASPFDSCICDYTTSLTLLGTDFNLFTNDLLHYNKGTAEIRYLYPKTNLTLNPAVGSFDQGLPHYVGESYPNRTLHINADFAAPRDSDNAWTPALHEWSQILSFHHHSMDLLNELEKIHRRVNRLRLIMNDPVLQSHTLFFYMTGVLPQQSHPKHITEIRRLVSANHITTPICFVLCVADEEGRCPYLRVERHENVLFLIQKVVPFEKQIRVSISENYDKSCWPIWMSFLRLFYTLNINSS